MNVRDWLKEALLEKAVEKYGLPRDAIRNMSSFLKLAGDTSAGFPTELLPLGASMWSGFILTPFAQQQTEGWVWPFWLRRQSVPSSPSFVPHGHMCVHGNVTHRNWTGVGLPGFPCEGTVDPRGLVTPWPFSPSVDLWVLREGELFCPSELEEVAQSLVDDLPFALTSFDMRGLTCAWTTFVSPLGGMPVVLSRAVLENTGKEAVEAGLVVSVRPYNNETICAINRLDYYPDMCCFTADGNMLVHLPLEPDEVLLSDYAHGDVAQLMREPERERPPGKATCIEEPFGLATGAAVYRKLMEQGERLEVCFACPLEAGTRPPFGELLGRGEPVRVVERSERDGLREWAAASGEGMRVELPEERYQKAFDVDKTFLLLMYDGQAITPGVSTYHMMWFRDAAYLVPALERMGHTEMARRILLTYPDRQTPEGFFRSHNGEWDSNGQAMWTLTNHYLMTGDREFLKEVYPSMMKAARWIDSMRRTDIPAGDPRHGLLPPGISAEHFGASDCYYWDDLWSAGGLYAAAGAARDLSLKADASFMEWVADGLMRDMRASWEAAFKRLGKKIIPIAPDRDVDSAAIGVLSAVYPLGLLPPEDEAMSNTVEEIVGRCFYMDTHYHGVMHCGINPYLSMHVAQYYLLRRDPYAHAIFESLWSMATDTYTYPEAINPLTWGGAIGDGHDGWSAGDIFNFVRNLLVCEEGDRLALLALPKKEWFTGGGRISVEGAPSRFGVVSYSVSPGDEGVEFELPGEFERPPAALELGVPFPVVSCEADGKAVEVSKGAHSVTVPPGARRVVVRFLKGVKS